MTAEPLLTAPIDLHLSFTHDAPPLPKMAMVASTLPLVPVPAARDHESLVEARGSRVQALPAYAELGWQGASQDLWVRGGVHDALQRAVACLPEGLSLVILDGWRSLELQEHLYLSVSAPESTADLGYVAAPSRDPSTPPPHLTGGAVDVTLAWHDVPLALGTDFDEFNELAHTHAFENIPGTIRNLRRILHHCLSREGFVGLGNEWWHYELGTRRWALNTGEEPWYGAATTLSQPS